MALALDGKVQSTNFFGTSQSASLTTTGGSGVIVVSLCHSNGSTASLPTATGLTFTKRGSTVVGSGGNNYNISHFTAPYTTNFSGSITCTISGGGGTIDIVAFGISGAATSSFFDSNGSLPSGAATGNVSGTTSNANDFVFCTYSTTSSDSTSPGPWISLFASTENFHHVMYQIVSAAGAQSPTLTTGGPAVGGLLDAIVQASSGTAFTLAGAEGAFTISGQSATMLRGIKVTGAEGAFTISGKAAALNKALKMAGAEGSFTISGQAAGMLRGIKLGGAEGAFVINGQVSAELRGIKLAGAEGAFTINGQAAVLSHGLHMPGNEGAFTISGQSAKFPVSLSMKGVEGAFTISGQGAVLTYTPAGGGGAAVSHSNPFFSTPGPGMALP